MPNSNTLPSNNSLSHPFFSQLNSKEDKARKIHRLLLDFAKDESEKDLKSICRQTADFFREAFFGKTEAQVRTAIIKVLEDYFDGKYYTALELEDLAEETRIGAETLLPVIRQMVSEKLIVEGRRRRWNEPGRHYNSIYKLNR